MSLKEHPRCVLGVLLTAALLARLVVIAVDASLGVLAQPPIVPGHHARASALAAAWLDGRLGVPLAQLSPGLTTDPMRVLVAHLLAPFYVVLAPLTDGTVVGRIAVAIYSLALGPLAYALAREVGLGERPAVGVAGATLFWPGIVYRSVVVQREVVVAAATLAAVWVAVRWARRAAADSRTFVAQAALLALAGGTLTILRAENLLVVAAVLAVAVAVRYRERVRVLVATGTAALAGLALVATYPVTFIGRWSLTPAILDEYAHARAHGDTAYLTWLHYESWLDIVIFAPLKLVYYLGSPIPWQVDSLGALLAGVSGWALLVATAFAVYGAIVALRRGGGPNAGTAVNTDSRSAVVLLTFLIVGVGAYSIVEMNAGAAFRRRIQFVPVILVFDMVALPALWQWISAKRNTNEYAVTDSAGSIPPNSE